MSCQVFTALSVASRAYAEVHKLSDAITEIVQQAHKAEEGASHEVDDELGWVVRTYAFELHLKGIVPRRRLPSQVVFHFDLFRDVPAGPTWPHAMEAILLVAYAPYQEEGWSLENLGVEAGGDLPELRGNLLRVADGRLLQWDGDFGDVPWSERDWIFGVPMARLSDMDAVRREVTGPLLALLSGGNPDQALAGTSPVVWAGTV